ncbi:biopolymer transporter Tol [Melioribacteraceae bacterium 4301-Me]|uniref:TolB family protein n=1 Tax=Pyranulibacter aquaticus TaxID=3163344 RepID=UPI00359B06F7
MKKILFMVFCIPLVINAQFNEYNPNYQWLTIKGKHVFVHFHPEAERTARVIAKIADEVWGPITSLYQYEPEPVHFVIKDIDDYSNGATYFFDNKIEIWASALDFDLRGSHNWLRNVISHEFTHMVQIQAGMKMARTIPAFYFQFLNYEEKRRPDILYGFPNVIVTYPIPTVNIPAWFAEGTAQYMRKEFNYDNWDTHRDMILRCYALDNKLLTWNQMGVFGKTSLGNESVYNAGFALTRYISQKYGENKLREITHKLGNTFNFTIDAAFKEVLGKDGNQIYNEWKSFLISDYKKRIHDVELNKIEGEIIENEGFGNFYPIFYKNNEIIYVSNKGNDYLSLSSIYLLNIKTKKSRKLVNLVNSTVSIIPNTNKIVYAKLGDDNPKWANIHDIYIYDISKDEEKRITFGMRANNPSVSNDGKKIVFIYQKDGTTNLGMVDIDGTNFKRLTLFENGEQVFNPKFSPDNSYVIFDYSYSNSREISKIDTSGANYSVIIKNGHDNRNPAFTKDGNFVYSSDITGIFNIYKYDMKNKVSIQLTNVIGGAFMPTVDDSNNLVYAGYTSDGFKLFYLSNEQQRLVDTAKKYVWTNNPPLGGDKPNGDLSRFDMNSLINYNDYNIPKYKEEKYSGFFSKLSFFPFIRYDNYVTSNTFVDRIKPGLYVSSTDYLNKYSIFAGGSINKKFERDLFLEFNYRDKLPILSSFSIYPELTLELYSVSRKTNTQLTFDPLDPTKNTNTDVTYNLFEVDLSAKNKIFTEGNYIETRFIFSQYSATIGSFIFPKTSILYPTTNDTYLIGSDIQVKFNHNGIVPTVDSDINPIGRQFEIKYDYEFNRYNKDNTYEIVDGILKPVYQHYNFHKVELNWKEYLQLRKGNTLNFTFRAAAILGPPVPDFFDFYLGGLVGMKSYPFYSVSGNKLGWLNISYRFPLWKNIDTRVGHLYVDKIYFSVYGDFGNAWTGEFPTFKDFKKGLGAEIRIKMNSFYLFPTSFFFDAAYAFDKFSRTILNEKVTYGKEWSFYGGILFDFNF